MAFVDDDLVLQDPVAEYAAARGVTIEELFKELDEMEIEDADEMHGM